MANYKVKALETNSNAVYTYVLERIVDYVTKKAPTLENTYLDTKYLIDLLGITRVDDASQDETESD